MLIKCPKCSAPFDIEKRGSVCPQCGTDTAKIKRKVVRTEQEQRSFKYQLVGSLGMLVLMIGAFIVSQIYIAVEKEKYEEPLGLVQAKMVEPSANIYLDGSAVQILNGEIIEGLNGHTPEGYSFLAVPYVTDESYYGTSYGTEAYLILPTGEYIKPLEQKNVIEVLNAAGVNPAGVMEYLGSGNGKMIFLVSNETKGAVFALYDMKKIRYMRETENSKDMVCVYHIPLEWEVAP